ncbi:MAG: ATP-binding cassette domain-containing protein [Thermoplasmata archaeon]|nr:ATP-binding cassette domain-containing protein [Thermoplasmata archaeon]
MAIVDISDLHKSYTTGSEVTNVLTGLDLRTREDEMIMIMGPSGSGKTTLLNLLGGIDKGQKGSISVDGREITGLDAKALNEYRRHQVGFIFQFYNLLPTLTARENVELGLEMLIKDKGELRERAEKYLRMVGLDDKMENFPQELSAGQQQRVAIARALAKEPTLILADEPTGNLDEERAAKIMVMMKRLQHELKITFIIVSHNSYLKEYMDRTLTLRHGVLETMDA